MIKVEIDERWLLLSSGEASQYIWLNTACYKYMHENRMGMFSILFHYYNVPGVTEHNYPLMYQPY